MDTDTRETFWKAFSESPYIMMRLDNSNEHAEPMTAQLDKDAHHAIWFFLARDNRIAAGGKAMGQVATQGSRCVCLPRRRTCGGDRSGDPREAVE